MKILMANWWPATEGAGGVQAHVYWLSRALQRRGHDVDVLHLADLVEGNRPSGRAWSARFPEWTDTAQTYVARMHEARRLAHSAMQVSSRAAAFDLMHFHDFTRIVPLSRRLHNQGIRLAWTNHLGEFLKLASAPAGSRITKRATQQFDAAIGPSQELAAQQSIGAPTTYIPNGVELARFPASVEAEKRELRRDLGVDPTKPLVVVPRRWSPTKGVLEAALALDHLQHVDLTVAFLGAEGAREYPAYGSKIATQLAGRSNVIVHDKVSYTAMSEWLRASTATLIPSVLEATSLSALEAMAAGSVVIAAPVGGLLELVRHQQNGIVLEDRQPSTIAAAVKELLRRPSNESDRLRARARRLVEHEYSWDAVAARTERVYREVLSRNSRAHR